VAEEAIDYDRNTRGILYMHRSQRALDAGVEHMRLLESDGQIIKTLDRNQVIALEPGLAHAKEQIAGAILCPTDDAGDGYVLARGAASPILARSLGISLPIYPIKGYSLTIPVGTSKSPPTIGC